LAEVLKSECRQNQANREKKLEKESESTWSGAQWSAHDQQTLNNNNEMISCIEDDKTWHVSRFIADWPGNRHKLSKGELNAT
jgi:hypothetical protein